jgi:hypothetical protein
MKTEDPSCLFWSCDLPPDFMCDPSNSLYQLLIRCGFTGGMMVIERILQPYPDMASHDNRGGIDPDLEPADPCR